MNDRLSFLTDKGEKLNEEKYNNMSQGCMN